MPGVSISSRRSFTLVEMLVAMAVLLLVLGIIFSIFGSASKLTDSVEREGDSANEARQVLDRIATDVSGMIIRPDVDEFFYKSGGNDKMFFYSQQAGYFDANNSVLPIDQSPVALVGYRVSTATPPTLQRLCQGITWDNYDASGGNSPPTTPVYAMSFLAFTYTPPTVSGGVVTPAARVLSDPTSTLASQWGGTAGSPGAARVPVVGTQTGNYDDGTSPDGYFDTIGGQVFRMEICFQQQNGNFTTNCPSPLVPGTVTNTTAMVVAIAVLDSKSRKLVTTTTQWSNMISALPDPTAQNLTNLPSPQLMDSLWNSALNSGTPITGIPPLVQSHIKVYQRYYYLNAPKFQ